MPFMKTVNGKSVRDYQKEKEWDHKNGRLKDRAARNKARKEAGLKVGDKRQADHIKPLSEGGSKNKSNVRVISAKANYAKETRRKRKVKGNN